MIDISGRIMWNSSISLLPNFVHHTLLCSSILTIKLQHWSVIIPLKTLKYKMFKKIKLCLFCVKRLIWKQIFTVSNWADWYTTDAAPLDLSESVAGCSYGCADISSSYKLHYYHPRPASTWFWDKYWQGRACTEWRPLWRIDNLYHIRLDLEETASQSENSFLFPTKTCCLLWAK